MLLIFYNSNLALKNTKKASNTPPYLVNIQIYLEHRSVRSKSPPTLFINPFPPIDMSRSPNVDFSISHNSPTTDEICSDTLNPPPPDIRQKNQEGGGGWGFRTNST